MKRDQKGFTIVELLIAVAILSIVVVSVCGFILVGSRSYAAGNSDINVQQEAQLALNQMSDVMIDTTRSVTYTGYDAGLTTSETALKDAEFSFTPEDKSLVMLNGVAVKDPSGGPDPVIEEGNGNKNYHFYWDKSEETLFYAEVDATTGLTPIFGDSSFDWVELASHVTDFSADLSQVEEKRVVLLSLTFMDGVKEYVTSNNVTIRNKVGVNDAKLEPLNKKKTISVAARDSGVIIEPGEQYHFSTPRVTGENVTDRSVTWSVVPSPNRSSGTDFKEPEDKANGTLTVAKDQQGGPITVLITTNAVGSDGLPATCTLDVNIKRIEEIKLKKTADTDAENGELEISPGCEFTISVTEFKGKKLGCVCSVCGDDVGMDKSVGYEGNPYGNPYVWLIHNPKEAGTSETWNPREYVKFIDSGKDYAKFRLTDNAPTSDENTKYTVVIQAMSILSSQPNGDGREYDHWVNCGIELTMVKRKGEDAEPYRGKLQYGDQTLDKSVTDDLPTDYHQYVTAIRVVDNSGKAQDKVLLHYTIGGGADYRICPDLFDLDLNGSYTFYIQALFPIAEERYVEGRGGYPDDNATIEKEYFNNLNKGKPYGYVGTRYRHSKVFYAKLDKPKLIFNYMGVDYRGKNITYDPVDIYSVGKGSAIVGEIKPSAYENIERNNGMNGMVYSVFEGAGSNRSEWKKWYYFDDSVMAYRGDKRLGDNVIEVSPGENPFMKLDGDDKLKACGDYHIVPGMLYQNKKYENYEIIAYRGFDPNLPRKTRYYEFDESTIHVTVNTRFNLKLWSYADNKPTKGEIYFPTPSEAGFTGYFDRENIDWQEAKKLDYFTKTIEGSSNTTSFHPSSMRCRYVKDKKVYELEIFYSYYDDEWGRTVDVSAGVYQCAADGRKWEQKTVGTYDSLFERDQKPDLSTANVDVWLNGCQYKGKMYLPLPSESSFVNWLRFERKKGSWQESQYIGLKYQPDGQQDLQYMTIPRMKCFYDKNTDEYTIQMLEWNYTTQELEFRAAFLCKSNGDRWRQWRP